MKHFVIYTALRIGLFLACFVVVGAVLVPLLGGSSSVWIWTIVAAAVISSLLSLKVLAGPRERFAQSVDQRAQKAAAAFERAKAREDAD